MSFKQAEFAYVFEGVFPTFSPDILDSQGISRSKRRRRRRRRNIRTWPEAKNNKTNCLPPPSRFSFHTPLNKDGPRHPSNPLARKQSLAEPWWHERAALKPNRSKNDGIEQQRPMFCFYLDARSILVGNDFPWPFSPPWGRGEVNIFFCKCF